MGSGHNRGRDAALLPDGKILVTGDAAGPTATEFAVVRLNANGSLDATFDGDGKALINVTSYGATPNAIAVQGDGRIVLAGSAISSSGFDPADVAVVRLNADGSLDLTFGGDGKVITVMDSARLDEATDAVLQQDGKILAVGTLPAGTVYSDIMLARYWP